jgi:predicted metal-dependent hydrolase
LPSDWHGTSNASGQGRIQEPILEWAQKMEVKVHALAVRPMRAKWASRSTAGNLQFSTDLLNLDREVGDYVIVHELLHFSVPNHGKLWKSLMRAHLGDYKRLENRLKRAAMRQGRTTESNQAADLP